MKNVMRMCALGVGVAAMFGASVLSAASFESQRVSIPFEFHVAKVTMPAGEYKVQESAGSGVTFLINVKTGQQVQMLRSSGRGTGRTRLVFENNSTGYTLKAIS